MTTKSLSEKESALFKKWLQGCLKSGPVTLTFIKKDGTERIMRCTTSPTIVMFKDPTILESKGNRAVNENVMPVYDLENDSWKSFRWENIKRVQITVGETNAYTHKT